MTYLLLTVVTLVGSIASLMEWMRDRDSSAPVSQDRLLTGLLPHVRCLGRGQ